MVDGTAFGLKKIHGKIRELCVLRFFNVIDKDRASVYEQIMARCDFLLERALEILKSSQEEQERLRSGGGNLLQKKMPLSDDSQIVAAYQGVLKQHGLCKDELNDIIKRAYWPQTASNTEGESQGEYQANSNHAALREWKAGENPYKDLQEASRKYEKPFQVTVKDIEAILRGMLWILERSDSPEEAAIAAEKILAEYHLSLLGQRPFA